MHRERVKLPEPSQFLNVQRTQRLQHRDSLIQLEMYKNTALKVISNQYISSHSAPQCFIISLIPSGLPYAVDSPDCLCASCD